jgi:hypothetical protein
MWKKKKTTYQQKKINLLEFIEMRYFTCVWSFSVISLVFHIKPANGALDEGLCAQNRTVWWRIMAFLWHQQISVGFRQEPAAASDKEMMQI